MIVPKHEYSEMFFSSTSLFAANGGIRRGLPFMTIYFLI